jgi:lysyl-tRNA synthetase class II
VPRGDVIKTQNWRNISLKLKQLRLLTKSLRPMPNQLGMVFFQQRRTPKAGRYIDLNINKRCFMTDLLGVVPIFGQATRQYLIDQRIY